MVESAITNLKCHGKGLTMKVLVIMGVLLSLLANGFLTPYPT